MHHDELVDAFRREAAALATAARAAGLDAPVPSCGDWTVADLCSHVGRLHRWMAGVVEGRPEPPASHWSTHDAPADEELYGLVEAAWPRLADALAAAGPDEPAWSWSGDHRVGFWSRRVAHETAVHRWDAQAAAGAPEPVDVRLAVDGIQEMFDLLTARPGHERVRGDGETIHLHCTDTDGEWLVRLTPQGVAVTREHAKGDVAARGTASDLLLLLWGRVPPDRVEVFGDASLLARWQELARF
ncbi:MAG: hypothetical protein KatS3mg009_3203 [Acidimicrobiia bacterium]|nr:MAG: hypothetical protein KatS3mg009_3203 [Acidimicrobiia bacterium]